MDDFKPMARRLLSMSRDHSSPEMVEFVAKALRDVQRETAEECCHILYFTDMHGVPSTWQEAVSHLRDAIRARFNVEPK